MYYLETIDLVKEYGNFRALDKANIQVPENKIYGLLGPNGAGKTTLIRIINQITAPDSGAVFIKGNALHPSEMRNIGYLPEERGLYKKMKVGEQILYLSQLKGLDKKTGKERMDSWLKRFDIYSWKDKKVEELSKGMQQKIQFIATVIHQPQLLIFDEPFSGFDPINANLLRDEILELKKQGATIIFSTHNMGSVEELCDEITLINKSKVILQGNVDNIREKYKRNLFRVNVVGNQKLPENENFTIIDQKEIHNSTEFIIRKTNDIDNNELIRQLSDQYSIRIFEEILPSMQEVFIETVSNDQEKKHN